MAEILSIAQKKTIFAAIPSSFTINSVAVTASKKYANQLVLDDDTAYPVISLNHSQDGLKGIVDAGIGGVMFKGMLTIHVYSKSTSSLNGVAMGDGVAQGIIDTLKTWVTPLTGDIKVFHPTVDIHPVNYQGLEPGLEGVHGFVFWVDLWHA